MDASQSDLEVAKDMSSRMKSIPSTLLPFCNEIVRSLFLTAKFGLRDVCWGSSVGLWVHPEDLTKMVGTLLWHQMWLCFLSWVSVT